MIDWWQVYYWDAAKDKIICFGFCSVNSVITDHPDYKLKNVTLNKYKKELLALSHVQVVKIC